MDEKHMIIKSRVERCYQKIKDAEDLLQELRKQCQHPETELATYSPRPGQYFENTKMCSICGGVISFSKESVVNNIDSKDTWESAESRGEL